MASFRRRSHDFGACNLQQAAIDRVSDGFLLHGGIDDDPLELRRAHRPGFYRRVEGGLEKFLDAGFADGCTKSANLGYIAGKSRRVVFLTTKVLPHDILGPPHPPAVLQPSSSCSHLDAETGHGLWGSF
jgi:hypothetical protein